jgi:hypothetical protein
LNHEVTTLIEPPAGKFTVVFSTKWQQASGKPVLVTHGTEPKTLLPYQLPENNCSAPEHSLTYLRNETLTIGDENYLTAVVQARSEGMLHTSWYALTPDLRCLELKSVAEYAEPDSGKGITLREPVSLILGEPDPQLFDIASKIGGTLGEVVPFSKWESITKRRSDEYKSEYERKLAIQNK